MLSLVPFCFYELEDKMACLKMPFIYPNFKNILSVLIANYPILIREAKVY